MSPGSGGLVLAGGMLLSAAAASAAAPQAWEQVVAAAKKEGRLNLYVGRYGTEPLLGEFRRDYPEIHITSVNGQGSQLGVKIMAEARAGKIIADIFSGGAATHYRMLFQGKVLDSIKAALILPEGLDQTKGYGGGPFYADPGDPS